MNVDTIPLSGGPDEESKFPVAVHRVLSPASLRALISGHPFFASMGEQHLAILSNLAMETKFEPGQYIFRKGDLANRFYLILDGLVELEPETKTETVHRIGTGEGLGWSWLFEPHFFHFSARTVAPTRSIFFYGTILRQYCEDDHDFGYEIMRRFGPVMVKDWTAFQRGWQEVHEASTNLGQNMPDF